MKMTPLELRKIWMISEALLGRARYALVCDPETLQEEFDRLDRDYAEALQANEHELALNALEDMGLLVYPRGRFWRDMERAALNMQLIERAAFFRSEFHKTRAPKPAPPQDGSIGSL